MWVILNILHRKRLPKINSKSEYEELLGDIHQLYNDIHLVI